MSRTAKSTWLLSVNVTTPADVVLLSAKPDATDATRMLYTVREMKDLEPVPTAAMHALYNLSRENPIQKFKDRATAMLCTMKVFREFPKLYATLTPTVKEGGAQKSGLPASRGIGAWVKTQILAGVATADILAAVEKAFPGAKTSAASIALYRADMRKAGTLPKQERAPKVCAEARKAERAAKASARVMAKDAAARAKQDAKDKKAAAKAAKPVKPKTEKQVAALEKLKTSKAAKKTAAK